MHLASEYKRPAPAAYAVRMSQSNAAHVPWRATAHAKTTTNKNIGPTILMLPSYPVFTLTDISDYTGSDYRTVKRACVKCGIILKRGEKLDEEQAARVLGELRRRG